MLERPPAVAQMIIIQINYKYKIIQENSEYSNSENIKII